MRRLSPIRTFVPVSLLTTAILLAAVSAGHAQTPVPAPKPKPSPAPKKPTAEIPDKMTDIQRAGELTTKPEIRQSEMKLVPPIFSADRQRIFTGPSDYRKPGRLTIGTFFPRSQRLRDASDSVFIALGGSIDIPPRGITMPIALEGYFDSAFSVKQDANEVSLIGVGLGVRYYPGTHHGFQVRALNNPRLFIGLAAGAYFVHSKIDNDSMNGTKLGTKVRLGLDFFEDWTLEASYTGIDKLGGRDFSGIGATASYRF